MKMTKIAASAAIKPYIPTRPREGRFHVTSAAGMKSAAAMLVTAWVMGTTPSFVFPIRVFRMFQVPQRAAAPHDRDGFEVVFGRRRGGGPLERPRIPRIASSALPP